MLPAVKIKKPRLASSAKAAGKSLTRPAAKTSSPSKGPTHSVGLVAKIGLGLLLLLLAIGLGYLAGRNAPEKKPNVNLRTMTPEELAALPDDGKPLKPGPWGNMEYVPIYIEPPEEYLPVQSIENADRRWFFSGFTREQLIALFRQTDVTAAQLSELLDESKWELANGGIYVNPSQDLVLSLSPRARKDIYAPLNSDPNNIFAFLRCSYPADKFEDYLANSGLPAETLDLVRKLSFPYGHLIFFCDMPIVLDTLKNYPEKLRLIKTLTRKSTLLLRLHITPDSDIHELEHYWVRAGWGIDTRPMLESLALSPHGARIDIVELFPPIPSADIYTFTLPSLKPEDKLKDCRWTALNFFNDAPDMKYADPTTARNTLMNDYYPVLSDPRYGDVVALAKPNGDIIHLAVFIADDIVYTKNSANFRDPYVLMTIPDMIDHFASQIPEGESLQIQTFRNKSY